MTLTTCEPRVDVGGGWLGSRCTKGHPKFSAPCSAAARRAPLLVWFCITYPEFYCSILAQDQDSEGQRSPHATTLNRNYNSSKLIHNRIKGTPLLRALSTYYFCV